MLEIVEPISNGQTDLEGNHPGSRSQRRKRRRTDYET